MARTLDATAGALWEEALTALRQGRRPAWIPDAQWRRAQRIASGPHDGWVGGYLGFVEDLTFMEAARRSVPSETASSPGTPRLARQDQQKDWCA
jgi:hypothetical protein